MPTIASALMDANRSSVHSCPANGRRHAERDRQTSHNTDYKQQEEGVDQRRCQANPAGRLDLFRTGWSQWLRCSWCLERIKHDSSATSCAGRPVSEELLGAAVRQYPNAAES